MINLIGQIMIFVILQRVILFNLLKQDVLMDDDFVLSYQDSGVSVSDKFVMVLNGFCCVEVFDGEGYLMVVEIIDSNGFFDG